MVVRQSVSMCMLLLVTLFVGCVTPVKHQKPIKEDYGCKPPPPDVFTAAGIDMQFAQSTFGKVITGEINIETNPQVIALASKAVIDDRIRSYLRCLAIKRDGYTPEQAAYFDRLSAFMQTKPNADQFLKWQKENTQVNIPDYAVISKDGKILSKKGFSQYGLFVEKKQILLRDNTFVPAYVIKFEKEPDYFEITTQERAVAEIEHVNMKEYMVKFIASGFGNPIIECNFKIEAY